MAWDEIFGVLADDAAAAYEARYRAARNNYEAFILSGRAVWPWVSYPPARVSLRQRLTAWLRGWLQ